MIASREMLEMKVRKLGFDLQNISAKITADDPRPTTEEVRKAMADVKPLFIELKKILRAMDIYDKKHAK